MQRWGSDPEPRGGFADRGEEAPAKKPGHTDARWPLGHLTPTTHTTSGAQHPGLGLAVSPQTCSSHLPRSPGSIPDDAGHWWNTSVNFAFVSDTSPTGPLNPASVERLTSHLDRQFLPTCRLPSDRLVSSPSAPSSGGAVAVGLAVPRILGARHHLCLPPRDARGCQGHPPPQLWQPKVSPDVARCPTGFPLGCTFKSLGKHLKKHQCLGSTLLNYLLSKSDTKREKNLQLFLLSEGLTWYGCWKKPQLNKDYIV